jgi:hypothetical protein
MEYRTTVACAWCHENRTPDVLEGYQVSHGICETCMAVHFGILTAFAPSQGIDTVHETTTKGTHD